MNERFARTELLLGAEAMDRLTKARVLVAGLGAVGSYAVEGLARAGVGHLRIADFDVVRASNINRQLYALESTLGRPKVELAAERIRDINPACVVDAHRVFIDETSAPELLSGGLDAVVDAIDSFNPKVYFLRAAAERGLFVVSSMGAATRTDPSKIRVADIAETDRCPLARLVRKKLRKLGVARGIRCIYSTEEPRNIVDPEHPLLAVDSGHADPTRRGRVRAPLGSLSCITGLFGLIAAREVILKIAGEIPAANSEADTAAP